MASIEAPLSLNGGFEARAVQANICNAIPILMELRTVRQLTREEMVKGIGKISRRPQGLKKCKKKSIFWKKNREILKVFDPL